MGKTYCCSDIHGMYGLWCQIKDFLKEDDTLYFLGDAIDRGDYGIQIMKELLSDKRVHYLLGNHEDIFLKATKKCLKDPLKYPYSRVWQENGGEPTMMLFDILPYKEKEYLVGKIKKLPREATYINKSGQEIFMCHAGTSPEIDENAWALLGVYDGYIWNRDHFLDEWPKEERYKNKIIVHGHTPTLFLEHELDEKFIQTSDWVPEVLQYSDGHKFDVDLGCFAFKRTALLDLDTFEVFYFEERKEKYE